jgi:ergothioneine biosynthesis protein EgtB
MVVQPTTDVSPPKWHLGHTTWFFENFILREQLPDYQLFDERLNWFFNSYYESQGPRILRSQRGNMTRPSTDRILAYRAYVDQHLLAWLDSFGEQPLPDELAKLLEIGLQHEQQHQELLVTDIKYILGHNPSFPVYRETKAAATAQDTLPELAWHEVAEGTYEVGFAGPGFCWDNELSRHRVYLHAYALATRLVTNREYLAFMEDGGYTEFSYWQMEGIEWARALEVQAPLYWYQREGAWYHYTLNGLRPLDLDAPVTHLSFYEADAYARWAGYRLPTEQEWEVAANQLVPEFPAAANMVEDGHWHPLPVQAKEDHQLVGHVWEWTNSAYLPYPRYPRLAGALGEYNGKFMVNQMVLRGGSCATPRSHIRLTYRNFFHADKRWQFTGLRLARDL